MVCAMRCSPVSRGFSIGKKIGWARLLASVACVALYWVAPQGAYAQSTFGTVLGTVKDPSGQVVVSASVQLMNTGTNSVRSALSNSSGSYEFVNVDVGSYQLTIETPGFQKAQFQTFTLTARETKRLDVDLKVASQAVTVNVEAASVVTTDTSNIAEMKGSRELIDLPVAITTRASGSTSAFATLTAQPGVQIDANNNISVAGTTPGQISVSIDGISSVGPGSIGALAELFPSNNAIEEIRVSETLNPAEYGGVADITTISKSGTNNFHGGLFENVQNTAFNASDTFSHTTPIIKMNNFGAYLGGPVVLPKLYNGRNKTFFFGSLEYLRLPKQSTQLLSVPTAGMRNGDLSSYLSDANGGSANQLTPYAGNIIPTSQLNPFSQAILNRFYPLPNYGPPGAITNNYLATYAIPINSAQGDIRVDEQIAPNHLVYARYTYKNRRVSNYPQDSSGNPSSPLVGIEETPEVDSALAVAYNWVISPSLVNEARGGFSRIRQNPSFGVDTQQVVNELGLQNLPSIPTTQDIPTVNLTGFLGLHSGVVDTNPRQATTQFLDNLTWTKGKHTMKFGGDFRYLSSLFTSVFADYRLGSYTYNGSQTGSYLGNGSATPLAAFLLGYPDLTTIASVLNPTTDSYAKHYAFFAQDDYKVSQSLTINVGLRWEYHPMFRDHNNNLANFDPSYTSTIGGQSVQGAVIVPNQSTMALVNPAFVSSISPTPVITAAQAGVPASLRFSQKTDFAPRIGFAYRIGGNNKTVLRGGYGRFIETLLTSQVIDGWAVEASDVGYFSNSAGPNGVPAYQAPYSFPSNIGQPGSYFFDLASNIHYKDPKIDEWNLTLERDLGKGVGLRASYAGNHGSNLGTIINLNELQPNTQGYNAISGNAPFPALSYIAYQTNLGFSNYNAGTISVKKRANNFQFEGSYDYTRNLTNVYGATSGSTASFNSANEFGGTLSTASSPGLDYGNVPFSRRHRFLLTFLYELPFGKGKAFLNGGNGITNRVVNGWTLSGVAIVQSGPFMTVSVTSDPSGTGYNTFNSNGGRADTVAGVNPYAGQSLAQWINPNAFSDPGDNIGRFGNSQQGSVVGPGTQALSVSLLKKVAITESARFEIGVQASNLFNHANYAPPPSLTVGVAGFGQVNALQSAEGAGPRALQLTGRFTF
jgi:hypothetical protein